MGESQESYEITGCGSIFIMSLLAHIRMLLFESGLGLDEGLIFYIPDPLQKRSILRVFEAFGAVEVQLHGHKIPRLPNHKMVLVDYQPFYKEETVQRYMHSTEYLSVLVVDGIMPERVKQYKNIILLDYNIGELELQYWLSEYKRCTEYIHKNVQEIFHQISYQRTRYEDDTTLLSEALLATVEIYSFWRTLSYNMPISSDAIQEWVQSIARFIGCNDEEIEVLSSIRNSINQYLDNHLEIEIGSIEQVEGRLLKAVNRKQAILYDDEFYYVPEGIMKQATVLLHKTIPYSMIKKAMHQKGIILCSTTDDNYTVKKCIVTVYGTTLRLRFLKLSRAVMDNVDALTLIERRENACT